MTSTILLVDDDPAVVASLALLLKQAGYRTQSASSPQEAMDSLASDAIDLVIQDMNFTRNTTGEEGLKLISRIKDSRPLTPVILMTGWGSIALAVQGVRGGASDFITKPWTNEQLLQSVKTALGLALVNSPGVSRAVPSREELDTRYDFSQIIGRDPKLLGALEIAGRVSGTDAAVLITGESGTGKELVAEAVHRNSPRSGGPFVKVNIAGISSTLFDSEMFGHMRGAFTDARHDRKGRFEMAAGGTILLDEIGDLDPACQVKMLRVLQDRTFEPLGSSESRSVDVRVVSATNADLKEAVSRGAFREDLFYRLNLISVRIPPLRERPADIPLLAGYFIQTLANIHRRSGLTMSAEAMSLLKGLPWPGNIRQLRHVIERAVLLSRGQILDADDVKTSLGADHGRSSDRALPEVGSATLEEIEKAMIVKSMEHFGGNISKVAESLGLSRAALYRRFTKFGIKA